MISDILAVGDSFTYGEELADVNTAYPFLLGKQLNATVTNLGKPGSGNRSMIRNVVEYVASKKPVDLVVVGWSSPGRLEFADEAGVFDIWPGMQVMNYSTNAWRLDLIEYIAKHHNSEEIYKSYILDAILLQNFLKQHNIKYIMLQSIINEYYHRTHHAQTAMLINELDVDNFVGWPRSSMYEWTKKCPKGAGGHFLEDGHSIVANKLHEHIVNKGWA